METPPTRLQIQAWDPSFGAEIGFTEEDDTGTVEIDLEIEKPLPDWAPVPPSRALREPVWFVDGVRRIDARATLVGSRGPQPVLFASIASGTCRCDQKATVESARVACIMLSPRQLDSEELNLSLGRYSFRRVEEAGLAGLLNGLRQCLREHERETAGDISGRELVIVDGPLTGISKQHTDHLIGYVKSHRVAYLTGQTERTLLGLQTGERTPLFRINAAWPRYSFYLRLPSPTSAGDWSGLCRLELSARLSAKEAIQRTERIAGLLPRFASSPHREPRAPQNLYPISGLEQVLRNRLGDPLIVLREIMKAF